MSSKGAEDSMASQWQIAYAANRVKKGGVIAYPTESVWGLGCNPHDQNAVRQVLQLKDRPEEKGMILLSGDVRHFAPLLAPLSEAQKNLLTTQTDRPTTWLVPDNLGLIPEWVKGKHTMVAIRVSRSPVVMALTKRLGYPIVSTSANPAGKETAKDILMLRRYFTVASAGQKAKDDVLDYILPGQINKGAKPSVIKNILNNEILRA